MCATTKIKIESGLLFELHEQHLTIKKEEKRKNKYVLISLIDFLNLILDFLKTICKFKSLYFNNSMEFQHYSSKVLFE